MIIGTSTPTNNQRPSAKSKKRNEALVQVNLPVVVAKPVASDDDRILTMVRRAESQMREAYDALAFYSIAQDMNAAMKLLEAYHVSIEVKFYAHECSLRALHAFGKHLHANFDLKGRTSKSIAIELGVKKPGIIVNAIRIGSIAEHEMDEHFNRLRAAQMVPSWGQFMKTYDRGYVSDGKGSGYASCYASGSIRREAHHEANELRKAVTEWVAFAEQHENCDALPGGPLRLLEAKAEECLKLYEAIYGPVDDYLGTIGKDFARDLGSALKSFKEQYRLDGCLLDREDERMEWMNLVQDITETCDWINDICQKMAAS